MCNNENILWCNQIKFFGSRVFEFCFSDLFRRKNYSSNIKEQEEKIKYELKLLWKVHVELNVQEVKSAFGFRSTKIELPDWTGLTAVHSGTRSWISPDVNVWPLTLFQLLNTVISRQLWELTVLRRHFFGSNVSGVKTCWLYRGQSCQNQK